MLKLKMLNKDKVHSTIFNITCIFILLQPIFDLLSFLQNEGYLSIGISTFAKPLIIGLINIALLLVYKKQIWRCAITYGGYLILMVVHSLLLRGMLIEFSVILHEIRFMINILYLLICYHDLRILYEEAPKKEAFFSKLKKALIAAFAIYIFLYLLSVVTGTAGMTYGHSDHLKQGFKGWMHSGQIFGHTLCVCLPIIICTLLNAKFKRPVLRVICKLSVILPILVLCLIGTKVSYYIAIIVLAAQVALELFYAIKDKKASNLINSVICVVLVAACILAYPITPVKTNTDINNSVLSAKPDSSTISQLMQEENNKHNLQSSSSLDSTSSVTSSQPVNSVSSNVQSSSNTATSSEPEDNATSSDNTSSNSNNINNKLNEAEKNAKWTANALSVIEQKYVSGELHPSDMRNRQLYFNWEKFKQADFKYKLFGIGYVMHGDMAIERDVLCMLFCFGIFGFILVLLRPIALWVKSLLAILKRPLKVKMAELCLFEGFSMFFFISWYAGATFIYTNFSVFLAILMCLLTHKINELKTEN